MLTKLRQGPQAALGLGLFRKTVDGELGGGILDHQFGNDFAGFGEGGHISLTLRLLRADGPEEAGALTKELGGKFCVRCHASTVGGNG